MSIQSSGFFCCPKFRPARLAAHYGQRSRTHGKLSLAASLLSTKCTMQYVIGNNCVLKLARVLCSPICFYNIAAFRSDIVQLRMPPSLALVFLQNMRLNHQKQCTLSIFGPTSISPTSFCHRSNCCIAYAQCLRRNSPQEVSRCFEPTLPMALRTTRTAWGSA